MRRLSLALVVIATLPSASSPQSLPESAFVVKLKFVRSDVTRGISGACLAVLPDGRFHMEQVSDWPGSGPRPSRIFEDLLPKETVESLHAVLEAPALKNLEEVETRGRIAVTKAAAFQAVIPRGETTQRFGFVALDRAAGRSPNPFPESLLPLIQWVEATTKALDERKLHPLKGAKPENCWLTQHGSSGLPRQLHRR
jgi:hypothetical protein